MKLKPKSESFLVVSAEELAEYIEQVYGRYYHLVDANGYHSGYHGICLLTKAPLLSCEQEDLELFQSGSFGTAHISLAVFMQDMINRNLIPPGDYLIYVG